MLNSVGRETEPGAMVIVERGREYWLVEIAKELTPEVGVMMVVVAVADKSRSQLL